VSSVSDTRRNSSIDARTILELTGQHLALSLAALAVGVAIAVPLGLLLERLRGAETIIRLIGTTQTIPSLALLGFLIPLLGVGVLPSLAALWLYSLFPILRATFSGVRDADPKAVEAATALGMTEGQVLRRVRLPLAVPAIMAGVRTAGVITLGTATLAAFIGAGGLGVPIIAGVQLLDTRRILSGAVPAALLAMGVDAGLGALERSLAPKGLR
jgi:osmoprotectant transport system permease protein